MTMRMPFGKYRGTELAELPDDCLAWLLTIDLRSTPLRAAVEAEAERRERSAATRPGAADVACGDAAMRLVNAGYRALAQQAHPDSGGAHEQMVELNAAVAILRRYVQDELL